MELSNPGVVAVLLRWLKAGSITDASQSSSWGMRKQEERQPSSNEAPSFYSGLTDGEANVMFQVVYKVDR